MQDKDNSTENKEVPTTMRLPKRDWDCIIDIMAYEAKNSSKGASQNGVVRDVVSRGLDDWDRENPGIINRK